MLRPLFLAASLISGLFAMTQDLPGPAATAGLGMNIHFTSPRPGEMAQLADLGVRWVRMDFDWSATEKTAGVYDFSAYDTLMAALKPHGIRALFILDYINPLYDQGLSPHSEAGRQAFAAWAAAAAGHYRGQGVIWEMYNEPNIGFWRPKPDADAYAALALAVGRAIHAAVPEAAYVGAGTSGFDLPFFATCFRSGMLEQWDAVTVHPYRQGPPETAAEDYRRMRELIRFHAPAGSSIPILSGEWGFSSAWPHYDEARQGSCLARQWLTNLANDVPLSIWYDWHDDGKDPKEQEHHFGTVQHDYRSGQPEVYAPKPAFLAGRTLIRTLDGFRFNKRLAVGTPDDHVLLFTRGDEYRLAVWRIQPRTEALHLPLRPGPVRVLGQLGDELPALTADGAGLELVPDEAVRYLIPAAGDELLRVAAAWERAPLEWVRPAGRQEVTLRLRNPLARPLRILPGDGTPGGTLAPGAELVWRHIVPIGHDVLPVPVRFACVIDGLGRLEQTGLVMAADPMPVQAHLASDGVAVELDNPSGAPFAGSLELSGLEGLPIAAPRLPLTIAAGSRSAALRFPCSTAKLGTAWSFGVTVRDRTDQVVLTSPVRSNQLLAGVSGTLGWKAVPDGDPKVASEQSVTVVPAPADAPFPGLPALRLTYRMDAGWKFLRLVPAVPESAVLPARAAVLHLWVRGGQGLSPRMRFADSGGQTFQPSSEALLGDAWRLLSFTMDGKGTLHWGGANDGVPHAPITIDSALLIDNVARQPIDGEILIQAMAVGW